MNSRAQIRSTGRKVRLFFRLIILFILFCVFVLPTLFAVEFELLAHNVWMASAYTVLDMLSSGVDYTDNLYMHDQLLLWSIFIILTGLFTALFWQIDALLGRYESGQVFSKAVIAHTHRIGWLLVVIFFAGSLADSLMAMVFMNDAADYAMPQDPQMPIAWFVSLEFSYLLSGIFVIAMSRMMQLGLDLQEDADATI